MPYDDPVALLAEHLEAENAHDLERTLATLTPDCVFDDVALGERYPGREGAAAYYQMWWAAFDTEVTPEKLYLAEGGIAVAETRWRGPHIGTFLGVEPAGGRIDVPVAIVVGLRDGLMGSERLYWDRTTVLAQLRGPEAGERRA